MSTITNFKKGIETINVERRQNGLTPLQSGVKAMASTVHLGAHVCSCVNSWLMSDEIVLVQKWLSLLFNAFNIFVLTLYKNRGFPVFLYLPVIVSVLVCQKNMWIEFFIWIQTE